MENSHSINMNKTEDIKEYKTRNIIYGILIGVVSSVIAAVILYLITIAFDIKPDVEDMQKKQVEIEGKCQELLDKLPPFPPAGLEHCRVGINDKVPKDHVWMYGKPSIEVERGSTILLTNVESSIKPSVQLTVRVIDDPSGTNSAGDFFVSRATLIRLDIEEDNIWDGIFSMKYKVLRIPD